MERTKKDDFDDSGNRKCLQFYSRMLLISMQCQQFENVGTVASQTLESFEFLIEIFQDITHDIADFVVFLRKFLQ